MAHGKKRARRARLPSDPMERAGLRAGREALKGKATQGQVARAMVNSLSQFRLGGESGDAGTLAVRDGRAWTVEWDVEEGREKATTTLRIPQAMEVLAKRLARWGTGWAEATGENHVGQLEWRLEIEGRGRWNGLLVPGSRVPILVGGERPGQKIPWQHSMRNHTRLIEAAAETRAYFRTVEKIARQTGNVTEVEKIRLIVREYKR